MKKPKRKSNSATFWRRFLSPVLRKRDSKRVYDIAQPSNYYDKHFAYAGLDDGNQYVGESLSKLRNRARSEVRNNCYARGIISTLANDVVGTGPQLQMITGDDKANNVIEAGFKRWGDECDVSGRMNLSDMLRLLVWQLCESGEGLFVKHYPDGKFQLSMLEPDYLSTPWGRDTESDINMGIQYNKLHRPLKYFIADQHPGAGSGFFVKHEEYHPDQIIHIYQIDRPQQMRGVPWITPALPLFAQLRRYTLAVISAAETAAKITGVIKTNSSDIDPVSTDAMDEIEIARDTFLTLPAGWGAEQMKAEQPTGTYSEFKAEIVNEMARCLNMPYNVAAANSAGYNYASGRLDKQSYYKMLQSIRSMIEQHFLIPVIQSFLMVGQYQNHNEPYALDHVWFWQPHEHVDPKKEAEAMAIKLQSNTTTLATEYAKQGKDWEQQLEQRSKELIRLKELNIIGDNNAPTKTKPDDDEGDGSSGEPDDSRISSPRIFARRRRA